MRADDKSILNSTGPGRNSIRITSLESWDDAVYVPDVLHIPEGCSTWPAFWTKSATSLWSAGGEIYIIEGFSSLSYTFWITDVCKAPRYVGFNLNMENRATLYFSRLLDAS